ncbi:MAG: NmrA/HSCARG family protein [Kouleothrix sp.]|jgi:uncharacterized protein YbjT (DUF2867 family)|nr:NmrA/HSCARG family protein [Kouleothrix sp.]
MSIPKIITVIGATGQQGGGLVRAILRDPERRFAVRAVTRDPHSERARALARIGAELVAADLDNPASLERAFDGAYGAFCVTFFWAHFSPEREIAQAHTMASAARRAGLQHVIWSTLEDSRQWAALDDPRIPTLMGAYKVPHMDAKAEASQAFLAEDVPTTFLLTSFFWENFISFGMGPRPGPDGELVLALPLMGQPLAGIAAEDIGKCAYGLFQRGEAVIGQTIGIAGEHLTGDQMAAAFAQALERPVSFADLPPDVYRNLGFPGAVELGNMFQIEAEHAAEVLGARDLARTRDLNPELQTFAAWLAEHRGLLQYS